MVDSLLSLPFQTLRPCKLHTLTKLRLRFTSIVYFIFIYSRTRNWFTHFISNTGDDKEVTK